MTEWMGYKWHQIENCLRFRKDLDSKSQDVEETLPIKLEVSDLNLHHLFWCVKNCEGEFHRCRRTYNKEYEKPVTVQVGQHSVLQPNWRPLLGIMAFEKEDDAILFRLTFGSGERPR